MEQEQESGQLYIKDEKCINCVHGSGGGDYNQKGVKSGQWIDLHDNYYDECQATYKGEYKNGIRTGKWITTYKGQKIGGGNYDEKGVKWGQWIDLQFNYFGYREVTYQGEYKNGIRTGWWITTHKGQEIGGGNYDEKGLKSGQWIDPNDINWIWDKVTFYGDYKNGIRTGKWIIKYEGQEIGGGNYDEKGVKSGQWIDIDWSRKNGTYEGEYKDGLLIGNWTKNKYNVTNQFAQCNEQGKKK